MPTPVHELRVFLASPGDLDNERESLRQLERRINATFRERGVRISISGWEEVQPEVGRPQALINPLVHECEIFIGLLNARWGSATGTHTSGFEEEFEIALGRRAHGHTPVIGVFFKEIDPERLADKGPQLTAVLAFRERVRRERLVLYKNFRNADDLVLEIFEFLTPYAMRLADEVAQKGTDSGATVAESIPSALEPADVEPSQGKKVQLSREKHGSTYSAELDSAQRQIVDAFEELSGMFVGGEPLSQAARDRVTLVGTAFAKDPELLGNHHVNRLYARREELDLTLGEARTWYRTYFANMGTAARSARTVPIWGVVDVRAHEASLMEELGDVIQNEDASVVRGVVRFMSTHSIRLDVLWPADQDRSPSDELKADARSFTESVARWAHLFQQFPHVDVVLNYLIQLAQIKDLPLLAAIGGSKDIDGESRLVVETFRRTLMGSLDGCEKLAPSKYNFADTTAIQRLLIDSTPHLVPSQLDAMLTNTLENVSRAAALELVNQDSVTDKQLHAVLELKQPAVHEAMVERAGRDVDWAHAIIKTLNKSETFASLDLVSRLLAASIEPEALEALDAAEQVDVSCWVARTIQDPEAFKETARDILDGVANPLSRRILPLQEKYAAVADYLTDRMKAAACDVLANVSVFEDRDVTRVVDELRRDQYVSRPTALRALIRMATRLNNSADRLLPDLGDLSVLDDYTSILDIDIVLVSPLAQRAVPLWRESEIWALRTAAESWQLQQDDTTDEALEAALYQDDDQIRTVAVDQLLVRWNRGLLEDLLIRYARQDRAYWYNVLALLDEHLYGYSRAAAGELH